MIATTAPVDTGATLAAELQAIAGFEQVNLLETLSMRRVQGLPWWSPLACVGLVASIALGSALQLNPLVSALRVQADQREALLLQQTQALEAAARLNAAGTAREQAQALQAALVRQERLLAVLGGGATTASDAARGPSPVTQDFSALLEGLSRTRVEGLWLTQVRLDRRTLEVRLEGQARHAQLVSTYIDDLGRNPRFKGLVLAAVEVTRPARAGGVTPSATGDGTGAGRDAPEPARFKLASASGAAATPNAAAGAPGPKAGATP